MIYVQTELEAALIQRMEQDAKIRRDIWDETFTKEQFARFIMMNMTALLKTRAPDISFFVILIKRIIY